jgi:hypothetical protein
VLGQRQPRQPCRWRFSYSWPSGVSHEIVNLGVTYLAGPRFARFFSFFSFFPSPSSSSSPFVAAFRCFFEMRSSSTCDVARLRVPCFGLALPPVFVLVERVTGMVVWSLCPVLCSFMRRRCRCRRSWVGPCGGGWGRRGGGWKRNG